jgi:hypothetical protein
VDAAGGGGEYFTTWKARWCAAPQEVGTPWNNRQRGDQGNQPWPDYLFWIAVDTTTDAPIGCWLMVAQEVDASQRREDTVANPPW